MTFRNRPWWDKNEEPMPEYRKYTFYRICPKDQQTCSDRACLGIEGYDENKCPGGTPAPAPAKAPAPAGAPTSAPKPDPNPADQGDWYCFRCLGLPTQVNYVTRRTDDHL